MFLKKLLLDGSRRLGNRLPIDYVASFPWLCSYFNNFSMSASMLVLREKSQRVRLRIW